MSADLESKESHRTCQVPAVLLMRLERKVSDRSAGQEEGEGRKKKPKVASSQGYPGSHDWDSLPERKVRGKTMVQTWAGTKHWRRECYKQSFMIGLRHKMKHTLALAAGVEIEAQLHRMWWFFQPVSTSMCQEPMKGFEIHKLTSLLCLPGRNSSG